MRLEDQSERAEGHLSVLSLLSKRSLRWQLVSITIMNMGQQLSGVNAVSRASCPCPCPWPTDAHTDSVSDITPDQSALFKQQLVLSWQQIKLSLNPVNEASGHKIGSIFIHLASFSHFTELLHPPSYVLILFFNSWLILQPCISRPLLRSTTMQIAYMPMRESSRMISSTSLWEQVQWMSSWP